MGCTIGQQQRTGCRMDLSKIWKNAGRYQVKGPSPMTVLITIAYNTAIDRLRAKRTDHVDLDTPDFEITAAVVGPEQLAISDEAFWRLSDRGAEV